MNCHVLKDRKITDREYQTLITDFTDFVKAHAGISPTFTTEERDYFDYPTEEDGDGDIRIAHAFLTRLTDQVKADRGKFGVDHVFILIHQDNWKSVRPGKGGIWGTNYSNIYHGYHVHYCRFDRRNAANSFGTFYHEWHHSLDALIKTELGINVAPLLRVQHYDRGITHGGEQPWEYIRWKENAASVAYLAPYLAGAYAKRRKLETMSTLAYTLKNLVHLYRELLNKKNGVTK